MLSKVCPFSAILQLGSHFPSSTVLSPDCGHRICLSFITSRGPSLSTRQPVPGPPAAAPPSTSSINPSSECSLERCHLTTWRPSFAPLQWSSHPWSVNAYCFISHLCVLRSPQSLQEKVDIPVPSFLGPVPLHSFQEPSMKSDFSYLDFPETILFP